MKSSSSQTENEGNTRNLVKLLVHCWFGNCDWRGGLWARVAGEEAEKLSQMDFCSRSRTLNFILKVLGKQGKIWSGMWDGHILEKYLLEWSRNGREGSRGPAEGLFQGALCQLRRRGWSGATPTLSCPCLPSLSQRLCPTGRAIFPQRCAWLPKPQVNKEPSPPR